MENRKHSHPAKAGMNIKSEWNTVEEENTTSNALTTEATTPVFIHQLFVLKVRHIFLCLHYTLKMSYHSASKPHLPPHQ